MKRNLDKEYVYAGEAYGPGEVEVPDGFPKDVGEKVSGQKKQEDKKDG